MNDNNICPNCGIDVEYEYGLTDMTKCPNCGADLKEE